MLEYSVPSLAEVVTIVQGRITAAGTPAMPTVGQTTQMFMNVFNEAFGSLMSGELPFPTTASEPPTSAVTPGLKPPSPPKTSMPFHP